jgi:hypothetical protein
MNREPNDQVDSGPTQSSEASADLVMFSATLMIAPEPGHPDPIGLSRNPSALDSKGMLQFDLGTAQIEVHGASERQRLFEQASADFLSALASAGADAEFVASRTGCLRLIISLVAVEGQAGIVITPAMFAEWAKFSPYVYIDG